MPDLPRQLLDIADALNGGTYPDEFISTCRAAAAVIERLLPYEAQAEFDARQRVRRKKIDEEIAAGIRCGSGIVGCNGGPNCPWDHK
jgi:hypothetical protein